MPSIAFITVLGLFFSSIFQFSVFGPTPTSADSAPAQVSLIGSLALRIGTAAGLTVTVTVTLTAEQPVLPELLKNVL